MTTGVVPGRAGAALSRLSDARRRAHLKVAGAVAIVGGLFAAIGLGDTLDAGPANWGAAAGSMVVAALLGVVGAAGVEIRYRARRRHAMRGAGRG